jgi:ABC-2 type transport system permease protein
MTTTRSAIEHTSAPHLGSGGSARRRVLALAAAETRLLLRNRTAVASSVLLPLAVVAAVGAITVSNGGTVDGPGSSPVPSASR